MRQHQGQPRELQKAIQTVDAVLTRLKPDITDIAPKRSRPAYSLSVHQGNQLCQIARQRDGRQWTICGWVGSSQALRIVPA
jgi:hypothetical protein